MTTAYPEAAWAAEFGSQSPATVWVNKSLTGIPPTIYVDPSVNNQSSTSFGDAVLGSGKTCSGEWIDAVVFENWLNEALKRNIFNVLSTSPKVKNTRDDLEKIKLAVEQVLTVGEKIGGLTNRRRVWIEGSQERNAVVRFRAQSTSAIQSAIIDGTLNF